MRARKLSEYELIENYIYGYIAIAMHRYYKILVAFSIGTVQNTPFHYNYLQ